MSLDIRATAEDKSLALPFLFDLLHDSSGWTMLVHNAEEKILVKDVTLRGDSMRMRMPLFDSEFVGVVKSDSLIEGFWHNYLKGPDYRIPFKAIAGQQARFTGAVDEKLNIEGDWEAHFSAGTADAYPALGLFKSKNGKATGTFCTETGDYRFLEGKTVGDSLYLSCFDGSHAFLFEATLDGDTMRGRYWSGNHWQEPFVAWRNPGFELRNPDSLTVLKEGYHMADFRFPGLDGKMVSPMDARFKGHVLMVQVMGSWCPNCVDETLLLDSMYAEYHAKGLDVIAIAFERYENQVLAIEALKRFRDRLNVKYDILYAGAASKDVASAKLPFLDHVMSYPTCIFIDRKGEVRRIRTGFYGPSTGEHYSAYSRNLRTYLEGLLAETDTASN
jgi:thiol-disulfide isomerase/thioredoxin